MEKQMENWKVWIFVLFAFLFIFVVLMNAFAGGTANAEPYQIPALSWEKAENCYDGKISGKHYMRMSGADGELRTLCMKAPARLPSRSWDHVLAMELAQVIDNEVSFPKISYLEILEIDTSEKKFLLIAVSDALTGKKYRVVAVFP